MKTETVKISDPDDSPELIEKAAGIIKAGGLVVFPTETVYGLGADATSPLAASKIYKAKGRPSNNPLIIHVSDPADAEKYAFTDENYRVIAKNFMPGPVTVILRKKSVIPYEVSGGLETVAVRCPSNKIAHALIEKSGTPVAAPSANISGRPSPTTAGYCESDLSGKVDMIIDGGESVIGLESTIVISEGDRVKILRPGAVTCDELRKVCENVEITPEARGAVSRGKNPIAPGMMYKHYAPKTPFVLVDCVNTDLAAFAAERRRGGENCAVICSEKEACELSFVNTVVTGDKDDLETQAHRLFSALREADSLGCDLIYARKPPSDGIGLALLNRMIRASSNTVIKI